MAGDLIHAMRFKQIPYIGNDGLEHTELTPDDGDIDVISLSTWREIKAYGATRGIRKNAWPEFDSGIDVPIREVIQENDMIKDTLLALDLDDSASHWIAKIVSYVKRGELICFCRE